MSRSSRSRVLGLALAALFGLSSAAYGAAPKADKAYGDHDHSTVHHDWHIEMETNKAGTKFGTLVVYSMFCHDTGFTQAVRIADDGSFSVDRALPDKKGRWTVTGRFTTADNADGKWTLTKGDCTDGHDFHAGDEHPHRYIGNPYEYPRAKPLWNGTSANARYLRHLKNASLASAWRFRTPAKAARLGYVLDTGEACPGFHHARKDGTRMWGKVLDPTAPQTVMYWCDSHHRYTLAAYMYRAPASPRPNPFGNLVQWHRHGASNDTTWMMHLWLVPSPVAAFATCAPFNAFAAAGMFTYETPKFFAEHADACSDTVGLEGA